MRVNTLEEKKLHLAFVTRDEVLGRSPFYFIYSLLSARAPESG